MGQNVYQIAPSVGPFLYWDGTHWDMGGAVPATGAVQYQRTGLGNILGTYTAVLGTPPAPTMAST